MRSAESLYMLDSNIVSALIDGPGTARRELCEQRLRGLDGHLAISVIVGRSLRPIDRATYLLLLDRVVA